MLKKKLDIIITEDDPDDRLLISEALKENHWDGDVFFAEDGEALLEELQKRKAKSKLPALIFLDLNMPKMDGRQALEKIKGDQKLKHIPVIVLTTSNAYDDILFSYQSGSNTYFTKPSQYSDLLAIIKSVKTYWTKESIQLL